MMDRTDFTHDFHTLLQLWFAGLRGAVAYACAREFPDVYGHRDDFIAATMVIVVITIVLMGGATEPLMDRLGIRMNVDTEEYMRTWHQKRKLKGRFLHFGVYRTHSIFVAYMFSVSWFPCSLL